MKKNLKKMMFILLAATLSFGTITGCGKSDEKEADEIAEHLREEAASEGVDLDEEIAEEMEDYESKRLDTQNTRITLATNKDELADKYFDSLDVLYANYEAATDPQEIQDAAKEYNDLYSQMIEEALSIDCNITEFRPILRSDYLVRMAYYGTVQYVAKPDTEMWAYYTSYYDLTAVGIDPSDPENYDAIMVLYDYNENNEISHITLIKNGTDVIEFDPSAFGITPYEHYQFNASCLSLDEIKNGDFNRYVFDHTGSSLQLVQDNVGTGEELILENTWSHEWSTPDEEGLDYIQMYMHAF